MCCIVMVFDVYLCEVGMECVVEVEGKFVIFVLCYFKVV